MAETNVKVRSANLIKIVIDGSTIGLMKSVSLNDDYSPEPASGIGSPKVVEYVPTMARYTLQCDMVCVLKELLVQKGFIPKNAMDSLKGIVFDIEVYDTRENILVKKFHQCSYASGSTNIQAHQILSRSMQVNCIDISGDL